MLAIFFPAVTGEPRLPCFASARFQCIFVLFSSGIMAGANISGEIRNPRVAIPKGTLMSVAISTVVYMALAVMLGASVTRETLVTDFIVMSKLALWLLLNVF